MQCGEKVREKIGKSGWTTTSVCLNKDCRYRYVEVCGDMSVHSTITFSKLTEIEYDALLYVFDMVGRVEDGICST